MNKKTTELHLHLLHLLNWHASLNLNVHPETSAPHLCTTEHAPLPTWQGGHPHLRTPDSVCQANSVDVWDWQKGPRWNLCEMKWLHLNFTGNSPYQLHPIAWISCLHAPPVYFLPRERQLIAASLHSSSPNLLEILWQILGVACQGHTNHRSHTNWYNCWSNCSMIPACLQGPASRNLSQPRPLAPAALVFLAPFIFLMGFTAFFGFFSATSATSATNAFAGASFVLSFLAALGSLTSVFSAASSGFTCRTPFGKALMKTSMFNSCSARVQVV